MQRLCIEWYDCVLRHCSACAAQCISPLVTCVQAKDFNSMVKKMLSESGRGKTY